MRRLGTLVVLLCLLTINSATAWEYGKPITPYLGNVGTRAIGNNGSDTTNRQIMSVATFFARDTISSLQIVCPNFWVNGNGNEKGNDGGTGGTATCRASVEYPLGTCTQITFGGLAQGTIAAKSTLLSDAVTVSIPKDAKAKIRLKWVGSAGAIYNINAESTSLGDAMAIGVSGIADQTLSCDAVTDAGLSEYLAPLAILAQTTKPTVCIVGDSIAFGTADTPNASGDQGIVARSVGASYGYINLAVPSTQAVEYVSDSTVRKTLYPYCSHLIVEFGVTDFSAGQTVAQLKTNLTTIYGAFSGTVFQTTLVPETTTTDACATTANQTVTSWEANRTSFNDQLRAATFGPNGGIFDVDSILETALDSGLWKAGASFPQCSPWSNDGNNLCVHPTTCGYSQVQSSGIVNNLSIHYPYLLNRDLDPASNDNGPVFLKKVG